MRPNGNSQGTWRIFGLDSGRITNPASAVTVTMTDGAITRVNSMGTADIMVFGDRDGVALEDRLDDLDDLHDEDYVPGEDPDSDDDDDPGDPPARRRSGGRVITS